jgi:acyl carrier protein
LDLKTTIQNFIADNFMIGMEQTDLDDNDSLLEQGIIDSTGILELVTYLEEIFGIVIDDEEMIPENLDSVGNIVSFLERKNIKSRN